MVSVDLGNDCWPARSFIGWCPQSLGGMQQRAPVIPPIPCPQACLGLVCDFICSEGTWLLARLWLCFRNEDVCKGFLISQSPMPGNCPDSLMVGKEEWALEVHSCQLVSPVLRTVAVSQVIRGSSNCIAGEVVFKCSTHWRPRSTNWTQACKIRKLSLVLRKKN